MNFAKIVEYREKFKIKTYKDLVYFQLYFIRQFCSEHKKDIYLFGGFLRDLVLNKKSKDMDFIVGKNAQDLADYLEYVYNEILNTKVQLRKRGDNFLLTIKVDSFEILNDLVGKKDPIIDILKESDFTINALAINLRNYPNLLDLVYKSKIDKSKVISSNKNSLSDLKHKVIRINKMDPHLTNIVRAFKIYERGGFHLDEATAEILRKKSILIKFGLKKKTNYYDVKKKMRNKNYAILMEVAMGFREASGNKSVFDYFKFLDDHNVKFDPEFGEKVYWDSFFEIKDNIPTFLANDSYAKDFNSFLRYLEDNNIDPNKFGKQEIRQIFMEQINGNKTYNYSPGQTVGLFLNTIMGEGKWIDKTIDDYDERIYFSLKRFQQRTNFLNSLFDNYNLENLHYLKVHDLDKFYRQKIRISALLLSNNFEPDLDKLKRTSLFRKIDLEVVRSQIKLFNYIIAASLSQTEDEFKNVIVKIKRVIKPIVGSRSVLEKFLSKFNFNLTYLDYVFDPMIRIFHAVYALKNTKYENKVYTQITPEEFKQTLDKVKLYFDRSK